MQNYKIFSYLKQIKVKDKILRIRGLRVVCVSIVETLKLYRVDDKYSYH